MKANLPDEHQWRIQDSDGYMDLKMWDRARAELEAIPDEYRGSSLYQQARLRLALEANNWAVAADIARTLCAKESRQPAHWIQLAYALRRLEGIESARSILLNAYRKFPDEPVIPFNLACYECRLGHREDALTYLNQAEKLAPGCRDLALEDDDLEALWPDLEIGTA